MESCGRGPAQWMTDWTPLVDSDSFSGLYTDALP
jgi:hypothetical protein